MRFPKAIDVTGERGPPHLLAVIAMAVAWFGVLLQLHLTLGLSLANGKTIATGLVIYFGYFTILTNLLVAVGLMVPLLAPASWAGRFFRRPGVRTATAAAIAVVGLAYFFLLRSVWNPQGWQLVADGVLHYLTPLLFLTFWWIAVPKQGLRWWQVGVWTSYPLGYFACMLIRGELTGLYPYHFLDAGSLGWDRTLTNGLGVLAAFVLASLVLVLAGRWQTPIDTGGELGRPRHAPGAVPPNH